MGSGNIVPVREVPSIDLEAAQIQQKDTEHHIVTASDLRHPFNASDAVLQDFASLEWRSWLGMTLQRS